MIWRNYIHDPMKSIELLKLPQNKKLFQEMNVFIEKQ